MSIEQYIDQHRAEIDAVIREEGGDPWDDDERERWILNCEPLYLAAQAAGVDV